VRTRSSRQVIVSVCPAAVVQAPVERVWDLLTRPAGFDLWVDTELESAEPDGRARAGQRMRFRAPVAAGLTLRLTIDVVDVDAELRRLRFLATLPFGIENDQTTTLSEVEPGTTLVRFG
jgi:uncharacterized protein YndB with AHSA1/START domain